MSDARPARPTSADYFLITPARFAQTAQKADPVISSDDLDRLVEGLFERVRHLLTMRHFEAVLRGRFGFAFDDEALSLDAEPGPVPGEDPDPLSDMVVDVTAREVLAELSGRQLAILLDRVHEEMTLDQLAEKHGVSRSTADNELHRAGQAVIRHVDTDPSRMLVLEKLIELASLEGDD